MRSIRLHCDVPLAPGREIALPAAVAAHAVRVLRLQPGDRVTLFNGDGNEYPARLLTANTREARVRIESGSAVPRESPLRITLAQALARGGKMDWIIQKATELGVAAVVPLLTERSEVKLDPTRSAARLAHWRAVVIAACEQSGRNTLPEVESPMALDAWLASLQPGNGEARLLLQPIEGIPLRALQPAPRAVILVIGPEGGFGGRDLAALQAAGFRGLTLGPRILRTETAGLAAIAALQALHGDFLGDPDAQ